MVPHSLDPGVDALYGYADTIAVTRVSGSSDGNVFPLVIDPTALNGLKYTITFDTSGGEIVWNVDRSDGVRVLENQSNQTSDATSPIVDGIQFRVIGAPENFKLFEVTANGSGPLDPSEPGALDFQGFPTQPNPIDGDPNPTGRQQVGEGHYAIHTGDDGGTNDGGSRGPYDAFISRTTRNGWDDIIPFDFEMRFTGTAPGDGGGYAAKVFQLISSVVWVPFELWNTGSNTKDDPSDDYRMVPWMFDLDDDNTYNMSAWGDSNNGGGPGDFEHSASGGNNDPFTDWIYWSNPEDMSPGSAGYDLAEAELIAGTYTGDRETEVWARTVIINWNGGSEPPFNQDLPETGTIFRISSTKPNAPGVDEFTFVATAPVRDNDLARSQLDEINVFPNPYYGVNSEELNKYNRFVTFSHLPEKAKVRIFNLAGVLIKTIDKDDLGQFLRWDLANQDGLPVASGLYIAYIELPDLGETKILKLAIVQEQQILDRF